MISARTAERRTRGNSLAPVLLILGALAVSGLVFFFFTRKKIEAARQQELVELQKKEAAQEAAQKTAATSEKAASGETGKPSPGTAGTKPAAIPQPTAPAPFIRPADLAQQLTRTLASGDLPAAAKMIAPDDADKAAAALTLVEKIFRDLGYKAGAPEQAQMIGQLENRIRVAVPLTSPVPGAPPVRLMLDLERDPQRGWRVAQVHLPKELAPALAALPAAQNAPVAAAASAGSPSLPSIATPPSAGTAGGTAAPMTKSFFVVDHVPDALERASDFVSALLKLDYAGARKFVDAEKVPPVKLAALCIVFEDGKYQFADEKSLVATVATDTTSWVITRVKSELLREQTEFGLEMEKAGEDWRVAGLNLSKLLSDSAKPSAAGEVAYTPLIMNPKGGESIALFFELDQAVLHPRAQKQLDIVAGILKASPQKKLKIGGYTDALGSDDYNLNLSKSRAEAVKQFIISRGVPLAQVETTGFGKALPISPNVKADGSDNPEGRSRNRRAEILLDF